MGIKYLFSASGIYISLFPHFTGYNLRAIELLFVNIKQNMHF